MGLQKQDFTDTRVLIKNLREQLNSQLDTIEARIDVEERTFDRVQDRMTAELEQAIGVGRATAKVMDQIMAHFPIGGTNGQ